MRWIATGRRLFAALAACSLLACAGPAQHATPALWRAEREAGAAGVLFLLGSVHMGTREMLELGPVVDEAFRRADELVVEVDTARLEPAQITALQERYGLLAPSQSLRDRLSPEARASLDAYLARSGLPSTAVERFKPWFVSFLLAQLELQAAGYEAGLGVDHVLMERARGRMPIVAIETIASQLGLMDRLPPDVQDLMLRDMLARVDDLPEEIGGMIAAWRSGDERVLEELVFGARDEIPEFEIFYDRVFFERNATMAERLSELDGDGRARLVVLGAGHMLGARGVPALLSQRGYHVRRVRAPEALGGSYARSRSRSKNASSSPGGPAAMPASMRVFSWL